MFRYKRSIPIAYDLQGSIYFTSRRYKKLPKREQERIRQVCKEAGREHSDALLACVTGEMDAAAVCARYYISESTLERAVRRYYIAFSKYL